MDTANIEAFIKSLDSAGLQICHNLVSQALLSQSLMSQPNINDYVDYHKGFVNATDADCILAEIESLGFKLSSSSETIQNIIISSLNEPYAWNSKKGHVINHPVDSDKFPAIKSLMKDINSKFDLTLNSVLATCYSSGIVSARLHDDGEHELDPNQPICVVSFGAERKVEFVSKSKQYQYKADLALVPENCSIYVMKVGCQSKFKHRVRRDQSVKGHRVSLSFRCFVSSKDSQGNSSHVVTPPPTTPKPTSSIATPVKQSIKVSIPNLDSSGQGLLG